MTILKETTLWVLMDEKRGLIACGNVRDRHVDLVSTTMRVLTYTTSQRAKSAMTVSGFYTTKEARDYLRQEYGIGEDSSWGARWQDYHHLFNPVEVVLKIEEILPS